MNLSFRLEEEKDYEIVEKLTREAFWNVYIPGAVEHFIMHKIRKSEAFIAELDFVAIKNGEIVGNIVYTHSKIIDKDDKEHDVITFGPLSVLPEFQNQGIGASLIEYSKKKAAEAGFKAIVIYGNPAYYKKVGFESASKYGISRIDGKYAAALMAMELYEGALDRIKGRYTEDSSFEFNETEAEEFDKLFTFKEKLVTESQKEFQILSNLLEEDM